MKVYADYVAKVQRLLLDKSFATGVGDVDSALDNAADTLAEYRLQDKVQEYTATGLRLYTLPTDWDSERSVADYTIEYPVDDLAGEVQYLDPEMSEIYDTPTGLQLRFRAKDNQADYMPPAGLKFRLHYGVPFQLSANPEPNGIANIPDALFQAMCKLGARELCLIWSGKFAQQASALTQGDPTDYRNKSDLFQNLAKEFMKDFLRKVSPDPSERPGKLVMGQFIETPLHQYQKGLYPRDNSLRSYTAK